jgi:hypothetical protein
MLRGRTAGVIHPTVRHLISIGNSLSHAVESISSILPRLCAAPIRNMEYLSTTTRMQLCTPECGSPSINPLLETGKGFSTPAYLA